MATYKSTKDLTGTPAEIRKLINEKIRPESRDFYLKEVFNELQKTGQATIDQHAGGGHCYKITLKK
jgi:ATP-dependent Lon protease